MERAGGIVYQFEICFSFFLDVQPYRMFSRTDGTKTSTSELSLCYFQLFKIEISNLVKFINHFS